MLLAGLVDASGAPAGRGPRLRIGDEVVPAAELVERAWRAGHRLGDEGVVALEASPRPEYFYAVVGSLLAGATAVPVAAKAAPAEKAHMLADCGARVYVSSTGEAFGAAAGMTWSALGQAGRAGAGPSSSIGRSALLLYTSGTTGRPKGALLPADNLARGIDALAEAWGWTPDDTVVHGLPLQHLHGLVVGLLGPLHLGSSLVHTVHAGPSEYAASPGSMYFGVPSLWSRVARDETSARQLGRARLLVSGSAPLPDSTFRAVQALTGLGLVQRYGMTETQITLSATAGEAARPGTVGRPLRGVTARIVDEAGDQVAPGELGDLEVFSDYIFDGYIGDPVATAAAFRADGWFRTGDSARVDGHGDYSVLGRSSTDIIKTNAYRVGAGEVEDALLSVPGVSEAAVVGVPDDERGQRIVAYIVDDGVPEDDIRSHLAGRLSRHKWPQDIRHVETLPRNAMGKVLKRALVELGTENAGGARRSAPPSQGQEGT